MGQRRRDGVVDAIECLRVLEGATVEQFRANYQALIQTRLDKDAIAREPEWTEGIDVGSRSFIAILVGPEQFVDWLLFKLQRGRPNY